MTRTAPHTTRLGAAGRSARRLAGFSLVPVLAVVTPLLVTPLIVDNAGAAGFLAVAVGQAVGTFGGIVVALGWPLTGPVLIAQGSPGERRDLYRESVETRLVAFLVTAPPCAAAAGLLVPDVRFVAALTAVAVTANGFTSAWYYTGVGAARDLVVLEAGLRVVTAVVAGALLYLGVPLAVYPALLLVAAAGSLVLTTRRICGRTRVRLSGRTVAAVRDQLPVTGSRVARGAYSFSLTPLAAALVPHHAFVVAGLDRLLRSVFSAVLAVPQSFVAWVVTDDRSLRSRQRAVLLLDAATILVAGTSFYLLLPPICRFLFGSTLVPTSELRILVTAGLAGKLLSECLVIHGLLPARLERYTSVTLTATSALGCVLLVVAGVVGGTAASVLRVTVVVEVLLSVACAVRLLVAAAAPPAPRTGVETP